MEAKYHAGEVVQIKSTDEIVTISSLSPGISQMFYIVFQNGKKNRYKENELVPYVDNESVIMEKIMNNSYSNAESFQRYAYYRMFSETQEDNLFSYQGNKIIFNPFQYKPLMKFLSIDSDERLLIADEVGVGKTIEAGIIIDELISRGELKNNDSIMIVCPSILCRKWRNELKNKFLIDDFWIHDGKSLSYMLSDIKSIGKVQYPHSIVSEQLFRGEKYQKLLEECLEENGEPFFKMLIVDECHHYRNPNTNTHKFGALLSECSERVIMLSATPFNLRSADLYNQLHMLNPALFSDESVFDQLLGQIKNVNQSITLLKRDDAESKRKLRGYTAELKKIADENEYIKPYFDSMNERIETDEILSVKEKVDFEKIINKLNPIETSFTRTLKRDAIEHRVTRETMTIEVNFSPEEADVYESFLDVNIERYRASNVSERAFGLILNGLERIAASSIIALEKNIKKYMYMPAEKFAEVISEGEPININAARKVLDMLKASYSDLTKKIKRIGENDSKYKTFKQLVANIQEALGENKRIIVFSFYTETLKYLRRRLSSDGYKAALMYGKTPDETPGNQIDEDGFKVYGRNDIMRDFEKGEYEILLVSEVGGEGLDFQFCAALINYDLPYNPMRIEQRIGRIDRMGQKADKIIVGSMCIKNTIDMAINQVLLSRIANAADLVGELEPIIAHEIMKLNEKMITKDFSEIELYEREKEIEQRIEKAKQTREEFDEARYELVNDKGFKKEFEDSIKKSRITPHESLLFTYSFLKKENGCSCKVISESAAKIKVTKDMCERIKTYCKNMNFRKLGMELNKLIENNGELEIDFDGNSAYGNSDRVFFKPAGAWIHFVIDYIKVKEIDKKENVFYATIKNAENLRINKGRFWLFVYEMSFKGFFETKTYEYLLSNEEGSKIICLNEDEKKRLFQEVRQSKFPDNINLEYFDDMRMLVEEYANERKEQIAYDAMSKNAIKISSRMQAIKNLSDIRIRDYENKLMTSYENGEQLRKKIKREKEKTEEKLSILEDKLKYVGTYSLDSVCLIDSI